MQKAIETDTVDEYLVVCVTFLTIGVANVISGICGIMGLLCEQRCIQKLLFFFLIINVLLMLLVTLMQLSFANCEGDEDNPCVGFNLDIIFADDAYAPHNGTSGQLGAWENSHRIDRIDTALMIVEVTIAALSITLIVSLLCGWKLLPKPQPTFSPRSYYSGYLHSGRPGKNISSEYETD